MVGLVVGGVAVVPVVEFVVEFCPNDELCPKEELCPKDEDWPKDED